MISTDEMSVVGLGTERITSMSARDDPIQSGTEQIRQSVAGGINSIDTSPVSGKGLSEVAIGDYMDQDNCREDLFLTSKCGYEWDLEEGLTQDLSFERIQQELEESMNRLQIDVLDLYLLNTVRNDRSFKQSFNSLREIKSTRNVRNIGLKKPSRSQLQEALKITNLDFVQIPLSLFEDDSFERLEPICSRNEVKIIAIDVLNQSRPRETMGSEPKVSPEPSEEHFEEQLRFVLETYFEGAYPDETPETLMARWAVETPGVHSGLLEPTESLGIGAIVSILLKKLKQEDHRAIDQILQSFDR